MTENEGLTTEASQETESILVGDVVDGVVINQGSEKSIQLDGCIGRLDADEAYPDVGVRARFLVEDVSADVLSLSLNKAVLLDLWDWIQVQVDEEQAVDAVVLSETRDGYALSIRGLKALLSNRDLLPGRANRPKIGETLSVRIIQYRDRKNQLIASERALVEGSLEERRAELLEELEVGQVLTAEVRRFANFGAFVDLGGLDALLHVKDISWKRIQHPKEALVIGEVVTVQVLDFDRETEKVSVGLKQMIPDPWLSAHEKYVAQTPVSGRVVGLTKFGAFVMLDDGIEGLVHVSEMSWTEKIQAPKEKVTVGDLVDCWVIRCETDRRRLGLSMKDPENNPWLSIREKLPIGTEGDFTIARVVDFGVFVELDGGLDGLIHVSDFSWAIFDGDPKEMYEAGQTVRAIMLDIDEERGRANLGIKQLNDDLMTELMKKYASGQQVSVTITTIQPDGFYASIEDGLEGFVPTQGIPEAHRATLDDFYEAEQVIDAEITVHDLEAKRIELCVVESVASVDEDADASSDEPTGAEEASASDASADELTAISAEDAASDAVKEDVETTEEEEQTASTEADQVSDSAGDDSDEASVPTEEGSSSSEDD